MAVPASADDTGAQAAARARRRARILEAAQEALLLYGLRCPVQQVARLAGVSRPLIYQEFGSKDSLLRAVLEARAQARAEHVSAALHAAPGSREGLAEMLFDALAGAPEEILVREWPAPHLAELQDPGLGVLAAIVARGERQLTALLADGLCRGIDEGWIAPEAALPAPDTAAEALREAASGLRGTPADRLKKLRYLSEKMAHSLAGPAL